MRPPRAGHLANASAQERLRNLDRTRRKQEENDLRAVLGSPAGRRFVWALLERTNVFGSAYAGEALATAYNEGRRAVGIELLRTAQMQHTDQYVLALTEQLAALAEAAAYRKDATALGDEDNGD